MLHPCLSRANTRPAGAGRHVLTVTTPKVAEHSHAHTLQTTLSSLGAALLISLCGPTLDASAERRPLPPILQPEDPQRCSVKSLDKFAGRKCTPCAPHHTSHAHPTIPAMRTPPYPPCAPHRATIVCLIVPPLRPSQCCPPVPHHPAGLCHTFPAACAPPYCWPVPHPPAAVMCRRAHL